MPRETYQEDDGDIEHESAKTVEEESEQTDVVNLGHRTPGDLPNKSNHTVHDSADGSKIVQRDERVHLVVSGAQQALDHGKSQSLKNDTAHLEEHTNSDEVNFAHGSNDDTNNNSGDIEELLEVGSRNTQNPARDENGDGCGGLEHLDKSNREVQICQISTDQTQAEEDTDGHNGTDVNASCHLDGLAAVKVRSPSGHNLSDDCREGQVVGRKNDGVAWKLECQQRSRYVPPRWTTYGS